MTDISELIKRKCNGKLPNGFAPQVAPAWWSGKPMNTIRYETIKTNLRADK